MKLHSTTKEQYQTVTAYDDKGVEINAQRYDHSITVMPETPPRAWPVANFEALAPETRDAWLTVAATVADRL